MFAVLLTAQGVHAAYELGLFGPSDSELSDRWLSEMLIAAGGALVVWRAFTVDEDRDAWRAIGLSLVLYVTADLYYSAFVAGAADPPYPSVADYVYFANYVPLYVGVALLIRRGSHSLSPRAILEALTGALAIGSLAAAVALRDGVVSTDGSFAAVATSLVYPSLDVLLVTLLAGGLILQRGRPGRSYALLLAGLLVVAVVDTVYVARLAAGSYADGEPLDLGWPLSTTLIAVAAWSPGLRRAPTPATGWRVQAPFVTFAAVIVGLLIWSEAAGMVPPARVLLVLAVISLLLLQHAGRLEARTLRDERERLLREQRDQALEASRLKTAFLATMSHEIRSPLNGVIGMTELLRDTTLDDTQRSYTDAAHRSGEALLGIVDDILDVSKIEAGMLELDPAPFDLREVLGESVDAVRHTADAKGLVLEARVDADVPALLVGDAGRIRQVATNLLTNAVKFTLRGRVDLHVRAEAVADGRATVRVSVTDTGIGIATTDLDGMFEPFNQAEVGTARRFGGTGLGLTIARQLVELMDGTVGAESEVGRGSCFWFTLDLEVATGAATERRPVAGRHPVRPGLRVLVVDDGAINRAVAVAQLQSLGYEVDAAQDGFAALDRLAAARYDAVLMDCQMPALDGYETTRELRRREDGGPRTLVVALTANAMAEDRARCLDAGMDEYLTKPLRPEVLGDLLARALGPAAGVPSADPATDRAPVADVADGVLDRTMVEDLRSLGRRDFEEMTALYLEDAAALVAELGRSVAAGDVEATQATAHKLKGSSLGFGATMVALSASALDQHARGGTLDDAPGLLAELRDALADARAAFAIELARSGARIE